MLDNMQFCFNAAKSEIRKQLKVKVRMSIYECCRSCVNEEKLGMATPEQPIIWHYAGQGHAFTWVNGLPYYRDYANKAWRVNEKEMMHGLYFNHSNLDDKTKRDIVACFEKWGFVVDYDYSDSKCIEINFYATKQQRDVALAATAINSDMAVMV